MVIFEYCQTTIRLVNMSVGAILYAILNTNKVKHHIGECSNTTASNPIHL